MNQLLLKVDEFTDADHWRWILTDANGAFKADHQVSLNRADSEYQAFKDLYFYLRYYASPDRRLENEVEIIERVGRWIGDKLFGPIANKIISFAPATVRVCLPAEAAELFHIPLELGYAGNHPLALQNVSLVFETDALPRHGTKIGIDERLRILAIFSLPTDASALGLRRERYALKRLIERIGQTQRKAIELRILQYGATKDLLKTTLEEGEGWDLIHFSGHGLPGGLLLEKSDGTRDLVSTRELQKILSPAQSRVKLVILSACESAAPTAQEALRWLKLANSESLKKADSKTTSKNEERPSAEPLPTLGRALSQALDCAVIAMRYPVGDDFAILLQNISIRAS